MRKKKQGKLKIVGWREKIHLPEFGLYNYKVKVDTGARTSAIHADDIKMFEVDGKRYVSFTVFPNQKNKKDSRRLTFPKLEKRTIRSSTGRETLRPVVVTEIQVGDEVFEIELTLVNRATLGFRMLLGRTALKGRFVVDSSSSYQQAPSSGN